MKKLDFYQILSVSPESTQKELKIAYRKLALKLHPDKNITDKSNAEEKFKELNIAYKTLSNPEKRMIYDLFGNSDGSIIETGNYSAEDSFSQFFENLAESLPSFRDKRRNRSRSRTQFSRDFEGLINELFDEPGKSNRKNFLKKKS